MSARHPDGMLAITYPMSKPVKNGGNGGGTLGSDAMLYPIIVPKRKSAPLTRSCFLASDFSLAATPATQLEHVGGL